MSSVELVEAFHLAFLRLLSRILPPGSWCLKGGCNLRFFFASIRYSEDIDLDVRDIPVFKLRDKVASILRSPGLAGSLRPLGVAEVMLPDLSRAKQTETVQRFKIHLMSTAGEDIATKVEFSRRGMDAARRAEAIRPDVLAAYQMPPLIIPHYTAWAAVTQKLAALAGRKEPQARDVFDLYVLSTHPDLQRPGGHDLAAGILEEARERLYSIDYEQYRDQVVAFLAPPDRGSYERSETWDQIRLVAAAMIDRGSIRGS